MTLPIISTFRNNKQVNSERFFVSFCQGCFKFGYIETFFLMAPNHRFGVFFFSDTQNCMVCNSKCFASYGFIFGTDRAHR